MAEDFVLAARDRGLIGGFVLRLSNGIGAPAHPGVDRWTLVVNDLGRQVLTGKLEAPDLRSAMAGFYYPDGCGSGRLAFPRTDGFSLGRWVVQPRRRTFVAHPGPGPRDCPPLPSGAGIHPYP